jgi:hypothetical protein
MKIAVEQVTDNITLEFAKYGNGQRMVVRDANPYASYPVLGWCPHTNLHGGECADCSLVLDDDSDLDEPDSWDEDWE